MRTFTTWITVNTTRITMMQRKNNTMPIISLIPSFWEEEYGLLKYTTTIQLLLQHSLMCEP
jgi:hypothetical protein